MAAPSPDEDTDPRQAGEAFKARMRAQMEQARASGQSPEQIEALMTGIAREEMQRQAPRIAAKARSWWIGLRRAVVVGLLALVAAAALAWAVEHRYAAPRCEAYAVAHGLSYRGLDYPVIGRGSSTTSSSASCRLERANGTRDSVSLDRLEPRSLVAFAVSFALQIELTFIVAFVLIALLAASLGIIRRI